MAHYRVWQIISLGFLCIGVSELVLRGLVLGSRAGLVIGVVSLIASACGFWEAYAQWRSAGLRMEQIRRADAAREQAQPQLRR